MKPQTPSAGGIADCKFSRHQVQTGASCNPVRPQGKSRLRLGLEIVNLPDVSLSHKKLPSSNDLQPKRQLVISAAKKGEEIRKPQLRQAIKQWGFTHAHTAWKTLVMVSAAMR